MGAVRESVAQEARAERGGSKLAKRLKVARPATGSGAAGSLAPVHAFGKIGVLPPPIQAKLAVNRPKDACEREADRVAAAVTSATSLSEPVPVASVQQAPGGLGRGARLPTAAVEGRIARLADGGERLGDELGSFFGARLGADFGGVKVHRDAESARIAGRLGARAFTLGRSIFFGPDQYRPSSIRGRRLLAHELTHVVQQGAATGASSPRVSRTIQRAEEQSADEDAEPHPLADVAVDVVISADEEFTPEAVVGHGPDPSGLVDMSTHDIFSGDVFTARATNYADSEDTFKWTLPPELELVTEVGENGVHLRVSAKIAPGGRKVVEATITSAESGEALRVQFRIGAAPASPVAVDQERLDNLEALQDLRTERREKRQAFRSESGRRRREFRSGSREERRQGRSELRDERRRRTEHRGERREERQGFRSESGRRRREFRSGSREERREGRDEFRDQRRRRRTERRGERREERQEFRSESGRRRRELRSGSREARQEGRREFKEERHRRRTERREERRELRGTGKELRGERSELARGETCTVKNQKDVQEALEVAIEVAEAAVAALQASGEESPELVDALGRYMKWTPDPVGSSSSQARRRRIADVLSFARNTMLLAKHGTFECATLGCDENTGAFVHRGDERGDVVTVCGSWLRGSFKSSVARGEVEGRAYALLHEFVHLAGPQAEPEKYLHREWATVDAEEALEQADAYAALAWVLSGR